MTVRRERMPLWRALSRRIMLKQRDDPIRSDRIMT
jgi:hypothetical protein